MKLEELERYTEEYPFESIWRYDFTDDIYTLSGINIDEFCQEDYEDLKEHNPYKNYDSFREYLNIKENVEIINKDNLKYIEFVCSGYPNDDFKTYNGVIFYRTSEGQVIDIPIMRSWRDDKLEPIWDFYNIPFAIDDNGEYYFSFEFDDTDMPCCTKYLETQNLDKGYEQIVFKDYMDWNSAAKKLYYTYYRWDKTPGQEGHFLEVGKVGDEDYSYADGVEEDDKTFKEIIHHSSFMEAWHYIIDQYTFTDGILYRDVKLSYPENTRLMDAEKSAINKIIESQEKNKKQPNIGIVDENTVRNALSYTFSALLDNGDYETLKDVIDNCCLGLEEFVSTMDRDYLKECFSDEEELETFLCEEMDFDRDECVNLGLLEEQSEEL